MRNVTTNMTFGQVLFILIILVSSSLMFFYLGAKFGGDIMSLAESDTPVEDQPFLPDDRLAAEAEAILAGHGDNFIFHEALQNKTPTSLYLTVKNPKSPETKTVAVAQKSPATVTAKKTVIAKSPPPPTRNTAHTIIMPGEKTAPPVRKDPAKPEAVKAEMPATVKLPAKSAGLAREKDKTPPSLYAEPVRISSPDAAVYRLQVGSYAQKQRARQAKAEWERRGYPAEIIETVIPGKGKWYRINLGRFTGMDEVKNAQRKIMESYQQTAMILPE